MIAALLLASASNNAARSRRSWASTSLSANPTPGGGDNGCASRHPLRFSCATLGLALASARGLRFCVARPSRRMPRTSASGTASTIARIASRLSDARLMASSVVVGPLATASNLGGAGGLARASSSAMRASSAAIFSSPQTLRHTRLFCRWHRTPSGTLECSWYSDPAASDASDEGIGRLPYRCRNLIALIAA